MRRVARHGEIPIGENAGVFKDSTVDRRTLVAHVVRIGQITIKSQHGKLAVGNPFLFAAANQSGHLLGEFLQKSRRLLFAPEKRQAIERSCIGRRGDLSFPFRIEQVFDLLRHFVGANHIGVVGKPRRARNNDQHPPFPVHHGSRDVRKNLRPIEFFQIHPRHVIFRTDK